MDAIDLVITMGCENTCPLTTARTEDRALEDPRDKTIEWVREIRDEIKVRVTILVADMATDQEAEGACERQHGSLF